MAVDDALDAAEHAIRELAVYLSYDADAARNRGQPDVAAVLRERWTAAHGLADELHRLNPAAVAAGRRELTAVRALAHDLARAVDRLEPEIRRVPSVTLTPPASTLPVMVDNPREDPDEADETRKREAGDYTGGGPAYGYRAEHGQLVPIVDEQAVISLMRNWRRDGKSYAWIADKLNADGVAARRGRWHPATVRRTLSRPARRLAS